MRTFSLLLVFCASACQAVELPESDEPIEIVLPDYAAELRSFDYPDKHPISWHDFLINAGYGTGYSGAGRRPGKFFDNNWLLVDYVDRSADYASHDYLTHRGIPYEVYGSNEYQETIHFHGAVAEPLFEHNGIAVDYDGQLVMSRHYNLGVASWAAKNDFDAYIVCNNAPRWSAVINYDLLASPLLGYACSQDNIGGPLTRIGTGARGRYCDFCNRKFFHHLDTTGRLAEFRARYSHVRDYIRDRHMDVFKRLPPHVKWNEMDPLAVAAICDDPVMAEYQKFLMIAHAHNLMRYYLDQKVVAEQLGIDYDVHGNQGGGFTGLNAYQAIISELVDQVWFESAGQSQYDLFEHGWYNANGPLRHVLGQAMAAGRKPVLFMTKLRKQEPDLLEHELAEECAGGGVLFVHQYHFADRPDLEEIARGYWAFRHDHRALFTPKDRRRHAQVAIVNSIPTCMFTQYQTVVHTPHFNNLAGIARALFEGHVPFDAIVFQHPELRADRTTLDQLNRYRLLILPGVTCLSDGQVKMIGEYLDGGGNVAVIEACGVRDENNLPREEPAVEAWKRRGPVVELLEGRGFPACRRPDSETARELTRKAVAEVEQALGAPRLLSGEIPRLLWATSWVHGHDCVSVQLVNYDVDFQSATAAATEPFELTLHMPDGVPADEAAWLTAKGPPQALEFTADGNCVTVSVPAVKVYGCLVVGSAGLDRRRSDRLQGDAMLARARFALRRGRRTTRGLSRFSRGENGTVPFPLEKRAHVLTALADRDPAAYRAGAEKLLRDVAAAEDGRLLARWRQMADAEGAVLALNFGADEDSEPWRAVTPDTNYSADSGYGWLPDDDGSEPTPEEIGYAMARRYGKTTDKIESHSLPFWPYGEPPPAVTRQALYSSRPRSLRLDLPKGAYRVDVVTSNPSWPVKSFRTSGMVRDRRGVRLFDLPLKTGDAVLRQFTTQVTDGRLVLGFGGPTGWGASAVVVRPASRMAADQLAEGALRQWRLSPRFANPDWWPIRQTRFSPESTLAEPPQSWTAATADAGGVVHLGSNTEADTGDTVYATATIESDRAQTARLSLGSTSAAVAYLGGRQIGYLPNVRGLQRDEHVVEVSLKPGRNVLVLKLQRHWERHWMFYASVAGRASAT